MGFFQNLFGSKAARSSQSELVTSQPATQTREGVREQYFYKEYYDKVMADMIAFNHNTEQQYEQLIAERGPKYDGYKTIEFQLADACMIFFTIGYSRGDAIQALIPYYHAGLDHYIESWDTENVVYNDILNYISLGISLEDKNGVERIQALVRKEKFNDKLVQLIFKKIDSSVTVQDQMMLGTDEAIILLAQILDSGKEEAQRKMKLYLEKHWYTRDNLETLYDSHKRRVFFGYWSFEAAAITKLMKLDDSSYKDNPFYPYDLAHW